MSGFIAMLIAALGPLIGELLKKLIESLLNKAAKKLPPASTFASPAHATTALIDQAIEDCPKRGIARRALLRSLRNHAGTIAQGFPLTQQAKDEIADVGLLAAKEKV